MNSRLTQQSNMQLSKNRVQPPRYFAGFADSFSRNINDVAEIFIMVDGADNDDLLTSTFIKSNGG
jgi:hypothetical protein